MEAFLLSASEVLGEELLVAMGGLMVGMMFGAAAQRSRFCLRTAAIEFSRGTFGSRLAVWLLAFSAAVVLTQMLIGSGILAQSEIRQVTRPGSISGAILGGAMFGIGMVLARGCSSRMLVLSGQGNLRALLNGLVFAVAAQASLWGALSPAREWAADLWVAGPESMDALAWLGLGWPGGVLLGGVWLAAALYFGWHCRLSLAGWLGGLAAGIAISVAWAWTASLDGLLFMPVKIESITFTGPSANTLMLFLSPPGGPLRFDVALVPGVFLGSFLAAAWARELKLEGFMGGAGMRRYLIGAALMGFGGMLAGGCAVGSVTNASVFALTGWLALVSIWAAAGITDRLLDRDAELAGGGAAAPAAPGVVGTAAVPAAAAAALSAAGTIPLPRPAPAE